MAKAAKHRKTLGIDEWTTCVASRVLPWAIQSLDASPRRDLTHAGVEKKRGWATMGSSNEISLLRQKTFILGKFIAVQRISSRQPYVRRVGPK